MVPLSEQPGVLVWSDVERPGQLRLSLLSNIGQPMTFSIQRPLESSIRGTFFLFVIISWAFCCSEPFLVLVSRTLSEVL